MEDAVFRDLERRFHEIRDSSTEFYDGSAADFPVPPSNPPTRLPTVTEQSSVAAESQPCTIFTPEGAERAFTLNLQTIGSQHSDDYDEKLNEYFGNLIFLNQYNTVQKLFKQNYLNSKPEEAKKTIKERLLDAMRQQGGYKKKRRKSKSRKSKKKKKSKTRRRRR